jgi:glycosyltransferase involved in cell wall biosynthesis
MATYRRPDHVRRIVPLLVEQAASVPFDVRVVVVDNDPDGSAAPLLATWESAGVEYFHEPHPGISAARNRALEAAKDDDVIVFIDDDEEPAAEWLATLVDAWRRWQCAAIAGPVQARFEGQPDPWVLVCGVFDRVVRPTGMFLQGAASSNLLLDLRRLRALNLAFDNQFGLSGGSDTMLTHQLIALGEQIRWCDEALVYDHIPSGRSTRSWALRRIQRTSNTWTRVCLATADPSKPRWRVRGELTLRGGYRFGRGVVRCVRGVLTSRLDLRARGRCDMSSGIGIVNGAFGGVHSEYLRTPKPV